MAKIPVFFVGDWNVGAWNPVPNYVVWHLATPAAYGQYKTSFDDVSPIDVGTKIECWCGPIIRHHHNSWNETYDLARDPGLCTACLEGFLIWAMAEYP